MSHTVIGLGAVAEGASAPIPLRLVAPGATPDGCAAFARLNGFDGQAGKVLLATLDEGSIALVGVGAGAVAWSTLRALPARLPPGEYRLESDPRVDPFDAALAWALGGRSFNRYKSPPERPRARLIVEPATLARVAPVAQACALACDLVDTPANDMGPAEIETAARTLATTFGASVEVVTGDALLAAGYPAVHAVGRAAAAHRAPRMIRVDWTGTGGEAGPRLVLIGKGVAFDTGGLDLKPSAGMRWMKKDMGGAAHALALAGLVMAEALPVRLSLLIPAVENAVSADAMRPGDVLATRKGLSVEVGNTDAEGRLILADALALAAELEPDLTLDLATLTGAARAALGPEVVPFYTDDDALAAEIAAAAVATHDPVWRMPLWMGYDEALSSDVADLKNDPDAWAQAGSVTAALFLKRFAPTSGAWVHFDIFAWNAKAGPGRPVGAEAQTIRALHRVLVDRYGGGR